MTDLAGPPRPYSGPLNTFFDAHTNGPLQLQLRRASQDEWHLLRRFGYHDEQFDQPFYCPRDVDKFGTDLASIPWFFKWVVPSQGLHFPAILLHDALVVGDELQVADGDREHEGPSVDRIQADRIMRDAMKALGVGFVRRWLAWTGASIGTVFTAMRPKLRWRLALLATLGTIATLGVLATIDVLDLASPLPWMGERSTPQELVNGLAAALVVPTALSVLWGRLWRAGLIGGLAFAGLLHVTLIMIGFALLYLFLEKVVTRSLTRADADVEADQRALLSQVRSGTEPAPRNHAVIDLSGEVPSIQDAL